jgi:transketolase C-terminal domain/subunit
LNLSFLEPIFELLDSKEYATIINIHTGLWSYGKKISPETNDLDLISKLNFNIFEPIDLENMRNIFKQNNRKYIRLLHKEMPDAIFDVDELWIIDASMLQNLDSISLKTYWFAWNDGVILATGSLFATAIQTWEIIQNHNKQVSIFVLQKLNSDWTEEMITNIKNSKKLFILIDHNDSEGLKDRIENGLKNYWLSDIELSIISPKYCNLTTILNEYQEEQSDFDPEKLSQRIISKL